jgi:hypothetical protein
VTDRKNPLDRALDLFVYAPIGFALEARKALPDMIEKGRQQVTGQVTVARMLGQMAVQQGQTQAGKAVASAQKQATSTLRDLGFVPGQPVGRPAGGRPSRTSAAPASTDGSEASRPTPSPASPDARDNGAGRQPFTSAAAAELAIPDYDSLSASQVVPRLAGLSSDELEAVRAYEAAHRGRKTILNRVDQLQAG